MPSDSSGRYQSRFFNFLNRQALRLTDQFERAVRHVKVAAVWGAQIMLYPVYLLSQVGLSVGRQLTSKAEEGLPQLPEFTKKEDEERKETPLEADTPILRVLDEVTTFPLPQIAGSVVSQSGTLVAFRKELSDDKTEVDNQEATETGQLTVPSPLELAQQQSVSGEAISQQQTDEVRYVIQGVGCLLTTRTLVLVTIENQILDILTPQQQQKLASKISWEVANLLYQRRLVQASKLKQASARLSGLDRPRVLLPVRLFWKLMAWVQTSPVAIAANLFQESTLIDSEASSSGRALPPGRIPNPRPQLPGSGDQDILNQLVPPKAIIVLDRAIADLESNQLLPGTESLVRLGNSLRDRIASGLQTRRQQADTSSLRSDGQDLVSEESKTGSFQIQALIYAAIEYFFGRRNDNLSGTDAQERSALPFGNAKGERSSASLSQIPGNPPEERERLSGRRSSALPPSRRYKQSQLPEAAELDPWLSWDDLYGNSDSIPQDNTFSQGIDSQNPNSQSQPQLPEAFGSRIPLKPRNSIWNALKRFVGLEQAPEDSLPSPRKPQVQRFLPYTRKDKLMAEFEEELYQAIQTEDRGGSLTEYSETPSSVAATSQPWESVLPVQTTQTESSETDVGDVQSAAIAIPSTAPQETNLEAAPDWIETKAIPIGYVKHPLEQVLEWLDVAMFWMEEVAVKVWRLLWQSRR